MKAQARAKKAQAKHRQHKAAGGTDDAHESFGSGADGSFEPGADPAAARYSVFDGKEDVMLYWQSELSREEKQEMLDISEEELARALKRVALGADSSDSMPIEAAKVRELHSNAELMTSARCVFIDAIYAPGGHAESMSDKGVPPTPESASVDLILHAILGAIERKVLMHYERSSFYLRLLVVLLWWIWASSEWVWLGRYGAIFLLSVTFVALSSAASTVSTGTPAELAALSPFWHRVGAGFLRAKDWLIFPFDSSDNPALLRARTDIFLSSALLLDHAIWVGRKRYWLLAFLSLVLPTLMLAWEPCRSGGWNRSVQALHPRPANNDAGPRYIRGAIVGLSHLFAVYYTQSWIECIFVAALFFPAATTIILSTSAIALTGGCMLLSTIQAAVLGPYARRAVLYWLCWIASVLAVTTGYAASCGWILWTSFWLGVILLCPPIISYSIQFAGGAACSILLGVGLVAVSTVLVKVMQLILTREGLSATVALVQALWAHGRWFVAEMFRGAARGFKEGTAAAADEAAAGTSPPKDSAHSGTSDAGEMN